MELKEIFKRAPKYGSNMELLKLKDLFARMLPSIIPLAVSIYLVWQSQLKGATINYLGVPTIKVQEPSQEALRASPIYLNTEKFSVIFTNSGNRSGILHNVKVRFEPSEGFRKYFDKFTSPTGMIMGLQYPHEVIIIRDRSTEPIFFDTSTITLKREISKGFEGLDWGDISENENLSELINSILESKKQTLQDFVNFLKSKEKFGKFTLHYTYSARKRLFWEALKDREIDLNYEQPSLEPSYRNLLENWHSIHPLPRYIFDQLLGFIDQCNSAIEGYRKDLSEAEPDKVCKFPRNFSIQTEFRSKWEFHLLTKWSKYNELVKLIGELLGGISEFKTKCDELSRLYPTAREVSERNLVEQQEILLEKLEDKRLKRIHELKEELIKIREFYSS
ncbi:MAG: hypothetical protein ABH874_07185 [Methanobacteriota archaeon]